MKIRIILKDQRTIDVELDEKNAPKTVEHFLKLVDNNIFENVIFHRVIKNFMIQTGGYTLIDDNLDEVKETPKIDGEFKNNGYNNNLLHKKGVISMARTNDPNSATSQFFICSVDTPHLDGAYAAFGKVCDKESMKVVEDISNAQTTRFYYFDDFPVEPIIIEKVTRI